MSGLAFLESFISLVIMNMSSVDRDVILFLNDRKSEQEVVRVIRQVREGITGKHGLRC